jgi:hypothetical protein
MSDQPIAPEAVALALVAYQRALPLSKEALAMRPDRKMVAMEAAIRAADAARGLTVEKGRSMKEAEGDAWQRIVGPKEPVGGA